MTVIDERIYPLGNDGRYLALGNHSGIVYDSDRRDTTGIYVYAGAVGSDRTLDLAPQFALPWPVETFYVNQYKPAAETRSGATLAEGAARNQRRFQLYATPSLSFPTRVCAGANNRVLFANSNAATQGDGVWEHREYHRQGIYRLVDCCSGEIVLEYRWQEIDIPGPGYKSMFDLAKEVQEKKQKERSQSRISGAPVAVDSDTRTALFVSFNRYQIVALDEQLTLLSPEPLPVIVDYSQAVWCAGKYVASFSSYLQGSGIIVINPATSRIEKTFEFDRPVSHMSAAVDSPHVVCGLYGVQAYLVDIRSGKITKYRPHHGVSDGWSVDARLSESGALIASCADKTLCITDPALGKTHKLMPLDYAVHEEKHPGEGRIVFSPDFCFSGERLLVLHGQAVTVQEIPMLDETAQVYISDLKHPDYKKPHKFSSRLSLAANFEKSELGRVSAQLQAMWLQPLKIAATPKARPLPVSESHFGGLPDLPDGCAWPCFEGKPLAFIGQLNLEQIAAQIPDAPLPKRGLLSFFLADDELVEMTDESPVSGEQAWRMLYFPSLEGLASVRQRVPQAVGNGIVAYPQAALKFAKKGAVMPAVDSLLITNLSLSEEETENYIQLAKQLPEPYFGHQIFGFPGLIQSNTLELECELLSRGRDPYRTVPESDPDSAQIHQAAAEWRLLLQLASDNQLKWLWGDAGTVYWLIRREDLAAQDFGKTRVMFQCH